MATYQFTPPTEDTVSNIAFDAPHPLANRLRRYFPTGPRGRTVWKIDETTFTFDQPYPTVEDTQANRDSLFPDPPTTIWSSSNLIQTTYEKVFYGGHVYYLDDPAELFILGAFLEAEGYTVSDWLVPV